MINTQALRIGIAALYKLRHLAAQLVRAYSPAAGSDRRYSQRPRKIPSLRRSPKILTAPENSLEHLPRRVTAADYRNGKPCLLSACAVPFDRCEQRDGVELAPRHAPVRLDGTENEGIGVRLAEAVHRVVCRQHGLLVVAEEKQHIGVCLTVPGAVSLKQAFKPE